MATFQLEVNGRAAAAEYRDADVERVLLPLLDRIARCTERADAARARTIVFIAAPPGAGKSTLAATLERLAGEDPRLPRMQAIGMDGFHFPNAYLDSHDATLADGRTLPLRAVKGAPETFDVEKGCFCLVVQNICLVENPYYRCILCGEHFLPSNFFFDIIVCADHNSYVSAFRSL